MQALLCCNFLLQKHRLPHTWQWDFSHIYVCLTLFFCQIKSPKEFWALSQYFCINSFTIRSSKHSHVPSIWSARFSSFRMHRMCQFCFSFKPVHSSLVYFDPNQFNPSKFISSSFLFQPTLAQGYFLFFRSTSPNLSHWSVDLWLLTTKKKKKHDSHLFKSRYYCSSY